MKRIIVGLAGLVAWGTLAAQTPSFKPEIRPFAGVSFPTGEHRNLFTNAGMLGAQVALELKPSLHVVGTFGWMPAQTRYPVANDNVNIFTYDVGLELGMVQPLGASWELRPFLGAGAGGRTYAYASSSLNDRTCTAGYVAAGTEFQIAPWAFRLEGRDNLFCFKAPLAGAASKTRNELGLRLGLAYHFR